MSAKMKRRGLMLVLSSPSGAGKTTLSRRLLESDSGITLSVSATTRPKRPAEVHGRDYYFVSQAEFDAMVKRGEFLEHATVFGNSYGTPRAPVDKALAEGRDVLFDIDWQGTQQVREKAREDLVSVFILPPSREALLERLKSRAQDSAEVVAARMAKANGEMSHWAEYDYVVVNDDVVRAQAQIETILAAERLRRARQPDLSGFVRGLMKD
jgi:guanylate kinase